MTGPQPPAGWYPDPHDSSAQRWWDGATWTAHQQPAPAAGAPAEGAPEAPWAQPEQPRRRTMVWVVAGGAALVVAIVAVVLAMGSSGGKSKSTAADPAGWIDVVDQSAHFSDRLPAQPDDRTLPPVNVAGLHMTLNLATVRQTSSDGRRVVILVEDAEIAEPLPAETVPSNLREAIFSFAGASGFDLVSQSSTTFQGDEAWQGSFKAKDGSVYKAIAVMDRPTRMYIIGAPESVFDPVSARFRALP